MSRFSQDIQIGFVGGGDRRQIAELEALPIDSIWTGGHVASRNATSDVIVSMTRLASLTERVKIGSAVLLLPLYTPAIVARQIADIDRISDGRLIFGVGVGGEYPQEFRACQVPINERGARLNEAIPLLRKLWTAEPISHDGRFYPMEDVRMHPGPVQPGGPPIIVAGRQEAAMRRAASMGEGWVPYLYSPRRYAASVATIRDAAAAAGRDLTGFGWFAWIFTNVDPDGQIAREEAAKAMGGNYNQDFKQMVDSVAAAGTPAEVTDKLKAFYDAGARYFVFMPATTRGNVESIRRRLLDEVMPAVREHAASGA